MLMNSGMVYDYLMEFTEHDRIGYSNASTFIRVFKQSRGMTPSQYREKFN